MTNCAAAVEAAKQKAPDLKSRAFFISDRIQRYSREDRNIRTMRNMLMNDTKKFNAPMLVIAASVRESPSKP